MRLSDSPLPIILGSSSPFRQEVLRHAGVRFSVISPNIDESRFHGDDPIDLAISLARAKMSAILPQIAHPSLTITADQIVLVNGNMRGKPPTREIAREYLLSYRNHPAETISAVGIGDTKRGTAVFGFDRCRVYLKRIDSNRIEDILNEGTVFHCAGGFAIEHPLMSPFVDRIDGTIDSVLGMPMALVERLLDELLEDHN